VYYRKVLASKPAIESLSGKRWDQLPEPDKLTRDENNTRLDHMLDKHPAIAEYLV